MASWISCLPLAVLLLVAVASSAAATRYTVGDGSGWTTGVDYATWAGSKSFKPGDSLVFNYAKGLHTVVEVRAAEYMACTATSPLGSDSSGATTVVLKTAGSHYFICSIPGHCSAGMKLAVTVGDSSSPSSPSSPTTTPRSPTTPYTTPTPRSPTTTPTTPFTTPTPTTTTPYTTTPTSPACTGGTTATPVTPVTPGMTPFMAYPSAASLGSAALGSFGLAWFMIVQLALL
ncbi:blue copper protein-like [Phragmites australis]|uniref:blue copper protein-like n=1 Tax=Phragmites australis TaxID=29695 RepID=UPI002D787154|nr:blue copper protein-like [Phragmites australis]